jgi:hypothetical protein
LLSCIHVVGGCPDAAEATATVREEWICREVAWRKGARLAVCCFRFWSGCTREMLADFPLS